MSRDNLPVPGILQLSQLFRGVKSDHHLAPRHQRLPHLLHVLSQSLTLGRCEPGHIRPSRETGQTLLAQRLLTDKKKPLHAAGLPCSYTPGQYGTEQNLLQHQRFAIVGKGAAVRQKNSHFLLVHWLHPLPYDCIPIIYIPPRKNKGAGGNFQNFRPFFHLFSFLQKTIPAALRFFVKFRKISAEYHYLASIICNFFSFFLLIFNKFYITMWFDY